MSKSKLDQRRQQKNDWENADTQPKKSISLTQAAGNLYGFNPDTIEEETGSDVEVILSGEDIHIQVGNFVITEMGLKIVDENLVDFDNWYNFGRALLRMEEALQWVIGDWFLTGEFHQAEWGEKYEKAMQATDYSYSSLTKFAMVARNFDFFRRRKKSDGVFFSHHIELCNLPENEQDLWLDRVEDEKLSVRELREMLNPTGTPTTMDRFNKRFMGFAKNQITLASGAKKGERQQMADMLRKLADDIESAR